MSFNGSANISIPASAIPSTATGDVAATTVQAAIAELASEKAPKASPVFTGTAEVQRIIGAVTAVGASNIDLSLDTYFTRTISGATTFTVSNPPASGKTNFFTLELLNGGSAVVTWPASFKWPGGTAPTLTAAGIDLINLVTRDGGASYLAVALLDIKTP